MGLNEAPVEVVQTASMAAQQELADIIAADAKDSAKRGVVDLSADARDTSAISELAAAAGEDNAAPKKRGGFLKTLTARRKSSGNLTDEAALQSQASLPESTGSGRDALDAGDADTKKKKNSLLARFKADKSAASTAQAAGETAPAMPLATSGPREMVEYVTEDGTVIR